MALSVALTVSAFAATNVTATLRPEYHIVIEGTERTFTNANGTKVDPAIYNGSIYLPLRAIGEIMGKSVSWDGTTNLTLDEIRHPQDTAHARIPMPASMTACWKCAFRFPASA